MTRINVVPVAELCDKHLLAEYRELPRVFRLARPCADAPEEYTLGKGHVKFFYNKLSYLCDRYAQLVAECKLRGFNVQHDHIRVVKTLSGDLFKKYTPTQEALEINRQRIEERKANFKRKP